MSDKLTQKDSYLITTLYNNTNNDYYLNTIIKFRNETLKNDIKYQQLICYYDILEPIIITYIKEDKDKLLLS